ncbi:MAG TPA: alcohol dehydrogenase catalytic domain-containing protein [Pyrinomonadaceae bacterium]
MSAPTKINGRVSSPLQTTTMRASVLVDRARLEVLDVPCPQIVPHEVLLSVSAVGLCGTDAHIFAGHANYNMDERGQPIPLTVQPQILGHEISGRVTKVGSEVHDLRVGDHVVVDQGLNCRSLQRDALCEYCRTGDSHQCEFYSEHGITGLSGGLAEFIAIPSVNAVPVRSMLDAAEAALVEPLACIIHSSNVVANAETRYSINASDASQRVRSILICGAGPAGLLFIQYLRGALGYDGLLLVSEPNEKKRRLAESFCADEAFDPNACDLIEAVSEHTGGRGVEYLIEASGAGTVFHAIPGLVRKQATILLYGHGHAGVDLSVLNNVMFKEPTLITPVGASGDFRADGRPSVYIHALDLIERGRIEIASIITHRYTSLDEVQGALENDIYAQDYIKGVVEL